MAVFQIASQTQAVGLIDQSQVTVSDSGSISVAVASHPGRRGRNEVRRRGRNEIQRRNFPLTQ